jgi:hypothetical protein
MTSPIPATNISSGSCSTIYKDTLYVYSADAFQALPLRFNGTWSQLKTGVPVNQAVCVQGITGDGQDALWVVGGRTNDATSDYPGLQRYSFGNGTWATVGPVVSVTKNRINHAAVFLNDSASLLVYSGSQFEAVVPSSDTFLISILPPYNTQSFTTRDTPSISPTLLNWNNNSAITLGGSTTGTSIFRFDPSNGWRNISTSLPHALSSASGVQASLVEGSDNSKVLGLFDLGSTPVSVSQLVLQYANGSIASTGTTVSSLMASKNVKQPRDLTLADFPTYNSTYAPTSARAGYSIAQSNGLTAFTGGDAQNPVALFDQNTNAWIDTGAFFGPSAGKLPTLSSTPSSTPSQTTSSSPSATSTDPAAAAAAANQHHHTMLILGATLGSILGLIALLLILLLLLRWRKKRRADAEQAEKDGQRLSFADRGDPDMAEAGGAVSHNYNNEKMLAPAAAAGAFAASRPRSGTLRSESSRTALVTPEHSQIKRSMDMSPVPVLDVQRPLQARHALAVPAAITEVDSRPNSDFLSLPAAPGTRGSNGSGWSNYFTSNTKPDILEKPVAAVISPERSNLTPRNSILAPIFQRSKSKQDTLLDYEDMKRDESNAYGAAQIPPVSLAPEWDSSRVSQDITGRQLATVPVVNTQAPLNFAGNPHPVNPHTAGVAQVVRDLRPGTSSSRHGHSRSLSTAGSTDNGTSVFTHDPLNDDTQWTPVTRNDWSTPRGRNTVASSYYGGAEEPHSDGSDPDAAIPSPSFRPGAKGGNVLTGMASPKMRFDEAIGEDSPTPKARIMSAEKATPMPVMMGRQDRPQYGSVEGSPAMSPHAFSKPVRTDALDWVKLDK